MTRLPLRLRVAIAFALTTAVALGVFGLFIYLRVQASLIEQTRGALQTQLAALVHVPVEGRGQVAEELTGESFAQVLATDGTLVASSPQLGGPLLTRKETQTAGATTQRLERTVALDSELEPALLLLTGQDGQVLVVGRSLEIVEDALDGLQAQLLVGGPLALALAAGAGYLVAGSALRPMERMRRQAATISAGRSGQRLSLPPAHDELHRLAQTLNAMLDRLESALERERRFIAEAGHELRTPLAMLRLELDLALARPRPPEDLRAALDSASEEVERLTGLAEELLRIGATDPDSWPFHPSDIELGTLLHDLAERFTARATEQQRHIHVAGEFPLPIRTDRNRLDQVLSNLLDNALRHGSGDIALTADLHDGKVTIQVADQGHEVSPQVPDLIAYPLGDIPNRFAAGDHGLGLTIVRAMLDRQGGTITMDDTGPGHGTSFTITLPTQESYP